MARVLAAALSALLALACTARARVARPAPAPAPVAAPVVEEEGQGLLARWSRGELTSAAGAECLEGDGEDCSIAFNAAGADVITDYIIPSEGYDLEVAPPPTELYVPTIVSNGGAVEGSVRLRGAPPAELPGVPGSACAEAGPNPTLRVAPDGGVAGTVVMLADVGAGKPPALLGGVLDKRGCAFVPHIQIAAPIGINLLLGNSDAAPHRVRIRRRFNGFGEPLADGLPAFDQLMTPHRQADVPLAGSGMYEVTCETGHSAATAWIVVPRHPYYGLSDERGRFRLDDVPAGEYTLAAWHEPVVASDGSRGRPLEARARVRVSASHVTVTDLLLK